VKLRDLSRDRILPANASIGNTFEIARNCVRTSNKKASGCNAEGWCAAKDASSIGQVSGDIKLGKRLKRSRTAHYVYSMVRKHEKVVIVSILPQPIMWCGAT
jgi:hypothetical protein